MPMFNPETEYDINQRNFPILDFHQYKEEFVVRPPYQRKNVWSRAKQQALLDSLFRRYYVPRIVVRVVRLSEDRTVYEIVDGQQRINTAQRFLSDRLPLPQTLKDVEGSLPGKRYSELSSEVRRFINREIVYTADIVKGIDDPHDPQHQKVATEIFWRLQQGESLTYMERAHSKLASLARNFVVKYADDQQFDYAQYVPIDRNPDKHRFFTIIGRNNRRMQHLALLTRLLILEENDGPADIKESEVLAYVEEYERPNGIGDLSMENLAHAKKVLANMNTFYEVFKDDPMVNGGSGIREFRIEYFIISMYLLLRHLRTYYVFGPEEQKLFHQFTLDFYERWHRRRDRDTDILLFSDNRQQTGGEIEVRHRILRQIFFEYVTEKGQEMIAKDDRRAFSEAERIRIYRRDNGLCQLCLENGRPESEARVLWNEYEADHVIPHSRGGRTLVENAQVLCGYHNRHKGGASSV